MTETRVLNLEGKQRVSPFNHPSIHQNSTLEQTKLCQRPILSGLMSMRAQRVSPLCNAAQFAGSKGLTFVSGFPQAF